MDGPGEPADAAPGKVLEGSGAARVWNAFSGAGAAFHAGHWQGEPARIRVAYAESELCVILTGRVRLSDDGGASETFGPGEAFVVEPGFTGLWENIGRVTKIYAIADPPS
jgi:hypothetical protein